MKKDLIIAKQKEYIEYLLKAVKSESIICVITEGVRGKYESELAALESDNPAKELHPECRECEHLNSESCNTCRIANPQFE